MVDKGKLALFGACLFTSVSIAFVHWKKEDDAKVRFLSPSPDDNNDGELIHKAYACQAFLSYELVIDGDYTFLTFHLPRIPALFVLVEHEDCCEAGQGTHRCSRARIHVRSILGQAAKLPAPQVMNSWLQPQNT